MTTASEAVMRRWFTEVWNEQRLDQIHELWAEGGVAYGLTEGGADDVHGPNEWQTLVENMLKEFEDFRIDVEDTVTEGEKVAVRWILTGTYVGDVLVAGVEKGQQVRVVGMTMARVREGKIIEGWNVWDILGMIRQLGGDASMNKMLQ